MAPVKASRLVDVYFVSPDARTAAVVANALVDEYVRQNLELRQQSMGKSLEWLIEELARQQHTVESSERAMAEYRAAQQTTSLSDPQNIVTSRLNQLNDAATRARTVRAQKESLLRQIETLGDRRRRFDPGDFGQHLHPVDQGHGWRICSASAPC